jgi:hypothetical protein
MQLAYADVVARLKSSPALQAFFRPDEIGTIMRTSLLLPLAFALAHASAFAGPQTYKPRPAEIDEIKGVYQLDNGAILRVSEQRHRLYAQLGQRTVTEMVPVAEYRYVSPDQRMTMEFNPLPFDGQVVLIYPADLNLAGSELVTARVALR